MTPRSLQTRLSRLERLVGDAAEKKREREARRARMAVFWAQLHAASVVALVLYGEVDVHEPLKEAQGRATQKLRALVGAKTERFLRSFDPLSVPIADVWYPLTMLESLPGKDERCKIGRALVSAPIWLLKFTAVERDAMLLGFKLRDLSGAPELGRKARADRDQWPWLPNGTIDAGGPCDDPDPPLTMEQILTCCRAPWKIELPRPWITEERANERGTNHGKRVVE